MATVGGDEEWRRSGGTSRRYSASRSEALRVWTIGGVSGYDEPWRACPRPPPPFMCAARRGPTNHNVVGRPRSGRETKSIARWDDREEINLTFSPLISSFIQLRL